MAEDTPTPTPLSLAEYVNAVSNEDIAHAATCTAEATDLVNAAIGEDNPYQVTPAVKDRCVLEVGAELYYRRRTRHGLTSFESVEGMTALRISRDPMSSAWPLLRQFIPFGVA